MEDLTLKIHTLASEIQRISEREKFLLRIENTLLRSERQLSPGKEPKRLKQP